VKRIAIVDDEEGIGNALRRILRRDDWDIRTFIDPFEALQTLAHVHIDLVISDFNMPGMNGVEFLNRLREEHPHTLRIILSGHADLGVVLSAINDAEVFRFILKPWIDEELVMTVESALQFHEVLEENRMMSELIRNQRSQLKQQIQALKVIEDSYSSVDSQR